MPTMNDIQNAIDTRTAEVFLTPPVEPVVPVLFGNEKDTSLSSGVASYIVQSIQFVSNRRIDLGPNRGCYRRHLGYVMFVIHVRLGAGDLDRTTLQDRIGRGFTSRDIGGATMQDLLLVASRRTENWAITGLRVPFYFDELQPED